MRPYLERAFKASAAPCIRAARSNDVPQIHALVSAPVGRARLLARNEADIAATLPLWLVAEHNGTVIGCGALVQLSPSLVELRSLVVQPSYRGAGIGSQLVTRLIGLAQRVGARRILALTCAVPVFTRHGFRAAEKASFPEKEARDCAPCPLREHCPETAVVLEVEPQIV